MKGLSNRRVGAVSSSRRRRMRVAAMFVAGAAIVGSFAVTSYGPHTVSTARAATLGPPTDAAPLSPTGNFAPAEPIFRHASRPELLFIGTSTCPYCAVERWAIVKALSRFGTFSRLAAWETGAGIPTFDFDFMKYRSSYIAFRPVDANSLNLTKSEALAFLRVNPNGGTPLVAAGGYAMIGSYINPEEMSGKSFAAVGTALRRNSRDSFVRDVNAEANVLTTLLCHADGMRPGSACDRPIIHTLARSLR